MHDTMRSFFLFLALILLRSFCIAQTMDTLRLPKPVKQGGKPLMEALNDRHSSRDYTGKVLTLQQLADMLWAADGINRPDGRRTAPSARNKQEIELYLTMANGVFLYDAQQNILICFSKEDMRSKTGSQPFVKDAAVSILYVCNLDKSASDDDAGALVNAAFSAGAIAQNVYLYCASEGLGSVVRGSFDAAELKRVLNLNDRKAVIMTQTVGYTK
jgi:SagB-type dehydrogenase family enzyme